MSQHVGGFGIAYTAAKTALNTMNESINHENCHLGIRACALCPGEVATEILKFMPGNCRVPKSRLGWCKKRMLVRRSKFIAQMPPHVRLNEIHITPTWNCSYIGASDRVIPRDD